MNQIAGWHLTGPFPSGSNECGYWVDHLTHFFRGFHDIMTALSRFRVGGLVLLTVGIAACDRDTANPPTPEIRA